MSLNVRGGKESEIFFCVCRLSFVEETARLKNKFLPVERQNAEFGYIIKHSLWADTKFINRSKPKRSKPKQTT